MRADHEDLRPNNFPDEVSEPRSPISRGPAELLNWKVSARADHRDGLEEAPVVTDRESASADSLGRLTMDEAPRPGAPILAAPSQHAFENLFELSPDAIFISDEEGVIRSANPRSEEMFGYPRGELFGKPIDGLVRGKRSKQFNGNAS